MSRKKALRRAPGNKSGRPGQRGFSRWARLISSIALLIVVAGSLEIFAIRKNRALLQIGLNDHTHCTIAGDYPRQSDRTSMVQALGPYSVLLSPVFEQAPGDSMVSAHRCTIAGRDYVHMILRRKGTLISVVLTKRAKDEAFVREPWAKVEHASSIPVHEAKLDGYSVAGFEAGSYLGYVVSALPDPQNSELAKRIAPAIRRYTGA